MGTLYLVSTPIGNLEDVTERAARILRESDRVLAEDTRRTSVLLKRVGSTVPMTSLFEHNERARTARVVEWLDADETIALVSDAGTPLVSDPGERLVASVVEAGHTVVPVPGASAVLAALVASGLPTLPFTFRGFVPRKGKDRREFLDTVAAAEETTVVFESPERLVALLEALEEFDGERRIAVARELTKVHETVFRGTLVEAVGYYRANPPRGEVTVVLGPGEQTREESAVDEAAARALAVALTQDGASPSKVAREVARRLRIPKNLAYRVVHELPDSEGR